MVILASDFVISACHAITVAKAGGERSERYSLVNEQRTRFLKHLVEFRAGHL
jgi:hypothetical protein